MNSHPFLAGLRTNPDFLLQDIDFRERRGLVIKISETAYRKTAFLDERVFSADTQGAWFPLESLLQITAGLTITRSPHYISHIGHCGSTLISRLLGELPTIFSVREPVALLALAMVMREQDTTVTTLGIHEWKRLLSMSLSLLSRTYRSDDKPVIKLTSAAGNLLEPLLDAHAESKALLLYVNLETYLTTMLRAEATRESVRVYSRAWLSDLRQQTGYAVLGKDPLDVGLQTAINWLAMLSTFSRATQRNPGRTLWMNFDVFLGAPAKHMRILNDFLGLKASVDTINSLFNGELMQLYAKDPRQSFDKHMRQRELAAARQHFETEIRTAMDWAESLCMDIPALEPVIPYLSTETLKL
jgi:hypothetical protein